MRVIIDRSGSVADGASDLKAGWLAVLHAYHARVSTIFEVGALLLTLGEGTKLLPFTADGATILVGVRHDALCRVCVCVCACMYVYVWMMEAER